MSIKVMTQVFERYPNGGGEMLLALALADHAHDDGTRIYPGVAQLAAKTRQSKRTVQYQLRDMEQAGWLILVNKGDGGRGSHSEYRINPQWLKGAEIGPFTDEKLSTEKGAEIAPFYGERVQSTTQKGAIHDRKGCNTLHGQNRHEPSRKHQQRASARVRVLSEIETGGGIQPAVLEEFEGLCREKGKPLTPSAIRRLVAEARTAGMTLQQVVQLCNEKRWADFRAKWLTAQGAAPQSGAEDPESRSCVEAMGERLGLGRWNEVAEQWPSYKARVRQAERAEV